MADEILKTFNTMLAVIKSEKSQSAALLSVLGPHKNRIFADGKDANGAKIGTYSTRPISISAKDQARNTGRTFFPGGYSEYKRLVGKNPGYVILRNTDQMYADYGLVKTGNNFGYGFQNDFNAQKMRWMHAHFEKDIAHLSQPEVDLLGDVLVAQLNNA